MQIFENKLTHYPRDDSSVVTVGSFDGLHLGHRQLIERVVRGGSPSTVVTFYPHPQTIVARPGREIKILTLPYEKVQYFEAMGIERLVVLPFNRELMNKSADDFLRKILIEIIGMRKIVVGYDHAFGNDRKGNKDFLLQLAPVFGFEVELIEPYYHQGVIVSSTLIRKTLAEGKVKLAVELLGRHYSFSGWVVRGESRGGDLGFPTANLKLDSPYKMLPLNGVYAVYVYIKERKLPALLYIGYRPTYGYGDLSIEAYLLDYDDDLYGERMKVEFIDRLRGDIAFKSQSELVAQMKKDEIKGRKILSMSL